MVRLVNLRGYLADTQGVSAIQYGLVAGLVGVAIVGAVTAVGTESSHTYEDVAVVLYDGDLLLDSGTFSVDAATELIPDRWNHLELAAGLEGWDVTRSDGSENVEIEIQMDARYGTPIGGGDWIDLNTRGIGQNLTLSRDFRMDTGAEHVVAFETNDLTGTGDMRVMFGGVEVGRVGGNGATSEFTQHAITVTGGSGDGTNTLTFEEVGNDRSWGGIGLANIAVK